ncbi:ribonucleotide-diphosphate reductase subunit alpha [Pelagivirga sediminicola]|uniref:Ribonucleotide-diphosphate reductase subunit alpha n=1 Tax=Pelagivirga sediminicola TaxID=2170575 RepID=A0A2T7G4Q6_9RHOB|nr:sugar dehydrogenase complex small subunit [Pelagivirga sediminicola]PVA09408.1 ribonucleotide-diphosphate reductase subunit alpha [Pelagivirga sediminicola]
MDTNTASSPRLTRRGLLSAVSALAVLPLAQWPKGAMAADLDVGAFLALSKELTGKDDLYEDLAAKMLEAFSQAGKADDIAALVGGGEAAELENSIVATWYTGTSPAADDPNVLFYTDALIWQAMTFATPMAFCNGQMGDWADPPKA